MLSLFPIAADLTIVSAEQIVPYFNELIDFNVTNETAFNSLLKNCSDLDSLISEDLAWRYIRMTCNTANEKFASDYEFFVTQIQPILAPLENKINQKLANPNFNGFIHTSANTIYFKGIQTAIEIYSDANIPLQAQLASLAQTYSTIQGSFTVNLNDKEYTMQQCSNFLLSTNRDERKQAWESMHNARHLQTQTIEDNFDSMVKLRHNIALNAGFTNYRDYMFKAMCRFDYNVQDCLNFHTAIEDFMVPLQQKIMEQRKTQMELTTLKPWDTAVHPLGLQPLQPFTTDTELIQKTKLAFAELDPYFEQCIATMEQNKLLDLDSRIGKAPGGYNYPLAKTNMPFIFMNATGNLRDLETMVHEGGHAIHSFLMANLPLNAYKNTPSEIAELASMSMELLSMEGWKHFFPNSADLKRAQHEQLQGIPTTLCWIAQVDAFQHWIYTNPNHTNEQRTQQWLALSKRFGTGMVDYTGYETALEFSWHKQLHIFEIPFYYIEYGFAQLGALGVWNNYLKNGKTAIEQYKNALKLGYTQSIPKVYETAGAQFNFSPTYMQQLANQLQTFLFN